MAEAQATEAIATVAPAYPNWVTERTKQPQTVAWTNPATMQTFDVELYDFSFLGFKFIPVSDQSGRQYRGVNDELGRRLIEVQKALYDQCLQEKQAESPDKPITDVSEARFRDWCWQGQEPFRDSKPADAVGHVGVKDVGGSRSRHSSGSAVDIHLFYNPFIPVRNGSKLGGELHAFPKGVTQVQGMNQVQFHETNIWGPAVDAFDRAHSLFFGVKPDGTSAELQKDSNLEHAADIYDRFKRVSLSLQAYFCFAFDDGNEQPKKLDDFKAAFSAAFRAQAFHPDALHADHSNLAAGLSSPRANAVLEEYYRRIVRDYSQMKLATVNGNLSIDANGLITFPKPERRQRDPCKGIFNIRREAFVALVKGEKLRWGGSMFDNFSGDTMHYDLDHHFVDGQEFVVR